MLKNKNREKPVKNRNKLIDLLICLILAGGLILGLALDIVHDRTNYRVEFYQLSSKRISGSLRIVFLTDLHLREYGEGNSELAEDIESLSPDLILLGGDMVIDSVSDYDGMLSLCSRLSETAPIYGVLGNHEDVKIYLQKDSELLGAFEAAGVHLLINDTAQVKIGENTVTLIGLDGKPADFERYGGEEAMERSEKESLGYRICMAHVPTYFPERRVFLRSRTCRPHARRHNQPAEARTALLRRGGLTSRVCQGRIYALERRAAYCQRRSGRLERSSAENK